MLVRLTCDVTSDVNSYCCVPYITYMRPHSFSSYFRNLCKEILLKLLKHSSTGNVMDMMHLLMFSGLVNRGVTSERHTTKTRFREVNEALTFYTMSGYGSHDPTSLSRDDESSCNEGTTYPVCDLSLEDRIAAVVDLLNTKDVEKFRGDIFVDVLQLLAESVTSGNRKKGKNKGSFFQLPKREFNSISKPFNLAKVDIWRWSAIFSE